jgi:hypothetical protein
MLPDLEDGGYEVNTNTASNINLKNYYMIPFKTNASANYKISNK